MNTLALLTTRRSTKQLHAPAPNASQLENLLQAATQVPDHGDLKPWRFVVIHSQTGLTRFQQILRDTVSMLNFGEESRQKAEHVGNMAPMIIAVIFTPKPGKPEWEQQISAGCSAYAIQLAAKAQGFDSVWFTGLWVNSPLLKQAFDCGEKDKIIGLIMIGTAQSSPDAAKNTEVATFTQYW